MAEKRSLYLSDAALALPRRCDSLSGRINQVAARYSELLRQHGPPVRALFSAAEWADMLDACGFDPPNLARIGAIASVRDRVRALSCADGLALLEMIEADL